MSKTTEKTVKYSYRRSKGIFGKRLRKHKQEVSKKITKTPKALQEAMTLNKGQRGDYFAEKEKTKRFVTAVTTAGANVSEALSPVMAKSVQGSNRVAGLEQSISGGLVSTDTSRSEDDKGEDNPEVI